MLASLGRASPCVLWVEIDDLGHPFFGNGRFQSAAATPAIAPMALDEEPYPHQ